MTRPARTAGRRLSLAVAVGLTVAGCSTELPQPAPQPPPATAPAAVTLDQSARILDHVAGALAAGDEARSVDALRSRVTGPALTARRAEYAVARAEAAPDPITPLPLEPQTLVVPSTTQWPRHQLVVSEQPEDLSSPRLLVLRQDAPRDRYALWAWVRLLPGVQMPATASPEVGSEPLPLDTTELSVAPADVAVQYADVLANGDASAFAAAFAPDAFREQIVAARTEFQQIAARASGTFTQTHAAAEDRTVAMATADGGALVVSELTSTSTLTISGASLTVPPEYAAVSGGSLEPEAVLRNSLSVDFTDVVAFYVPPAGSDAPIDVLGGEHTFTSATGS